jgi:hypothetical protein
MPTRSPAIDAAAPGSDRLSEADAQDARVCALFAVVMIAGTCWFYENVLCLALRLMR